MTVLADFAVQPGAGLLLWVVVAVLALACGAITLAKGRWGWFLVGLLTAGLGFLPGAVQPAVPGSLWSRLRRSHRPAR